MNTVKTYQCIIEGGMQVVFGFIIQGPLHYNESTNESTVEPPLSGQLGPHNLEIACNLESYSYYMKAYLFDSEYTV